MANDPTDLNQTPPPNTPPLETSATFQQRAGASGALGGPPTHPTQFQAISPPASAGASTPAPTPSGRKANTTLDDDPRAQKYRASITTARQQFARLVSTTDQCTDTLRRILEELASDPVGKEEAKRQGFDLKVASAFTDEADAVIEKYKPRS